MLSYRHGFHAGNSADVLKHWVIERILNYLMQKPKPLFYCDTHAGAGCYALNSDMANKTAEYQQGIAKILPLNNVPAVLGDYLNLVKQCSLVAGSPAYPGSPWVASYLLRPVDRLAFCELHPQDYPQLQQTFKSDKRVNVFNEDGFKKSLALLPPKENRGLVVIDPSYEIKTDYETVVQHIVALHKRFATGIYALWYPVVNAERIQTLEARFVRAGLKNTQLFELQTQAVEHGGMYASGMIVVNAPWTLKGDIEQGLPWLSRQLAGTAEGYRLHTLCGE